jgi:hypothetical protein
MVRTIIQLREPQVAALLTFLDRRADFAAAGVWLLP